MERFLVLDVSFGVMDLLFMNPLGAILVVGLGILLIVVGVKAIRRELNKKKGLLEGEEQPAEAVTAESVPAEEAGQPAELPEAAQEDPSSPANADEDR